MHKNKRVEKSAPEQKVAKHESGNRIEEALKHKVTKPGNLGALALKSNVNGKTS
jgi:hypothetical protein